MGETRRYLVIAKPGKVVFGHTHGEEFTATLLPGEEYALIRGGFLAEVEEAPRPPRGARRQPVPEPPPVAAELVEEQEGPETVSDTTKGDE